MKHNQNVINFEVYEDSTNFYGMAKATLPSLAWVTNTLSGAGIAGNVEAIAIGHMKEMTLGLDFGMTSPESVKLAAPRRHNIELRVAQQVEDTVGAALEVRAVKHVFVVVPKTNNPGSVAPAAAGDGSGEFAVRYWATFIDGQMVMELDPMNYKCMVDGVDYLGDVRKALGK